jgi:ribonuclease BN (tRNA processing enzyme)
MRGKGNMPLVINSVIKGNKSNTNGLHNIINWGEDWIYAWNSEIEGFNYSLDKLDDKYNGLIEISEKIKMLDAENIDKLYSNKVKGYLNLNISKKQSEGGPKGFGTDNVLTKTAVIPQNILFVRNINKNGDGKSWETAFNNLQEGIKTAREAGGGEIWVAAGTYKPTTDNNRSASFVMHKGIAIYGGFSGNEKSKSERDYRINKTTLSGNIGNEKSMSDNSYHVVLGSLNSIIDGVVIADGYANGEITNRFGGGLYSWGYESSSIIKNCTFTNNYAEDGGAVFSFADVLSYFENVRFENNKASVGGAASFRFGASCELNNCTFINNSATSRAGAIAINYGSNVIINNSTFTKNSTDGNGGAIWVDDQASQYGGTKPIITDCVFSDNSARYYGGAIHNYNIATSVIQGCNFTNNEAKFGKDIANTLRSQVTIRNSKDPNTDIYNDEGSKVTMNSNQNNKNSPTPPKTLGDIDFSVTIIGSGNPQYNPERSQPSALVQYKGTKFLIDMGNGTKAQLNKLGLTGRNSPDALLITHHHIDHNEEFMSMVHSKFMSPNEFIIAGPSPIDEMTGYVKKFYKDDLNYRLSGIGRTFDEKSTKETVKVLKGGESFEYKGVKISTLEVPHSIKTIAYRFDADGKSIVITGDLTYTDNLRKLAKNVDILVIDGKVSPIQNGNGSTNQSGQNRSQQNPVDGSVPAHASIPQIAKMALECNAKTMVLTHLGSQPSDAEATSKRYSDFGYKGKVIIAADFLTVTPDGESFKLQKQTSYNNPNQQKAQNVSARNSQSAINQIEMVLGVQAGQQGNSMSRFDTNGDNRIRELEVKEADMGFVNL